jgi:hypothetical protein
LKKKKTIVAQYMELTEKVDLLTNAGLKPSTTLLLSNKLKAPSLRATIPLLRK